MTRSTSSSPSSASTASFLSRREWVARVSGPAIAMTLGAGALGAAPATGGVGAGVAADVSVDPARRAEASPPGAAGARVYNIRDFGARGDGATLDTAAVQAAIDLCTRESGGTVLVPAGDFLVGTLELKSNVTLHLSAQGRLLGSGDPAHYREGRGVPPSNGNIVMISASEADNVTIEGPGTIDGNGAKFFTGRGDNTGPGQKSADGYFKRPHLLVFHRCRNLRVRDTFLTASAYHCMRILRCERVFFDGVRIHNRVNKNNDGFHFYACRHVHVSNCDVTCQDDACALFGSNRYVTVVNCSFSTRWSVFRFGGGEAADIAISNCLIYETYGCAIKMRCGARTRFENIAFSNLTMNGVTGPISIGLDSASREPDGNTPPTAKGVVRNISFNGIRATVVARGAQHADLPFPSEYRPGEVRTCIALNGVAGEFLENISFTDVHVLYEGGGTAEEAAATVPNMAGEYFEIGTPPAYGFYARGVRGLSLHNVRFETKTPDRRPVVVLDRVTDATFNGFGAQAGTAEGTIVRAIGARDVLFSGTRVLTRAATFLRAEGADTDGLVVDGGDVSKAAAPVSLGENVRPAAVKVRA